MAGDEDARVAAIRKRTKTPVTHLDRVLYPDAVEYCLGIAPARYAAGT
jgi:hypothetical protein